MVVSIGAIASAAQGVSYYENDGYYARDDPEHLNASAWAGKGAEALGLSGAVDPDVFSDVLEGTVPDGSGQRDWAGGKRTDRSTTVPVGTSPFPRPSPFPLWRCWATTTGSRRRTIVRSGAPSPGSKRRLSRPA